MVRGGVLSLEDLIEEVRRLVAEREIRKQLEEVGIELPADLTPPEEPHR